MKTVSEYRHDSPRAMNLPEPDTRPGDFYVSVWDGRGYKLACGPFVDDHAGALAAMPRVRETARESRTEAIRRLGTWGAWGTCRLPDRDGPTVNPQLRARDEDEPA